LVGDVQPVSITGEVAAKSSIRITDDPTALAVREETILAEYPLDYQRLVRILNSRYTDFKTNKKFYDLKKQLIKDAKYCRSRYLDPANPKSSKKDFYSPAIIAEFDKQYARRKKTSEGAVVDQAATTLQAPAKVPPKVA
jgi:hypothetical protein